jgi:selenocysteine lyase/cysteine desulfurase
MPDSLSALRAAEFPQLSTCSDLDSAGAMVLSQSQCACFPALARSASAPPHSAGQFSAAANALESLRSRVCHLCGTTASHYFVVFAHNATHALRLFGDLFPWGPSGHLSYLRDNHTSILGLLAAVEGRGCGRECVEGAPAVWASHVFAYLLQSKLSGRRYLLS